MSEIQEAKGGDGWSSWVIEREPSGRYFVVVTSKAEKNPDGVPKVIYIDDTMTHGRQALDRAIAEASAYAHRMYS